MKISVYVMLLVATAAMANEPDHTEAIGNVNDCHACSIQQITDQELLRAAEKIQFSGQLKNGQYIEVTPIKPIAPEAVFKPFAYQNQPITISQCNQYISRIEKLSEVTVQQPVVFAKGGTADGKKGFYDYYLRPYQNLIDNLVARHGQESKACLSQLSQRLHSTENERYDEVQVKRDSRTELQAHSSSEPLLFDKDSHFNARLETRGGLYAEEVFALRGYIEILQKDLKTNPTAHEITYKDNGQPIYMPIIGDGMRRNPGIYDDVRLEFLSHGTYLSPAIHHVAPDVVVTATSKSPKGEVDGVTNQIIDVSYRLKEKPVSSVKSNYETETKEACSAQQNDNPNVPCYLELGERNAIWVADKFDRVELRTKDSSVNTPIDGKNQIIANNDSGGTIRVSGPKLNEYYRPNGVLVNLRMGDISWGYFAPNKSP